MLVVTTDHLPGHEIRQVMGEVIGATGRVRNPFIDRVRLLQGGRDPRMSRYLARWRKEAVEQMTIQARERGANAVVGMRFDHREISEAWGEMCAYGTAVYAVPISRRGTSGGPRSASGRLQPARGESAIP